MLQSLKNNRQTIGLVGSIVIGFSFPQLHVLSFLIKYLIMTMLFFAFLNMDIKKDIVHRSHVVLLTLAPIIAITTYFLLLPFNKTFALVAFLVAMTPTATASPVITRLLGGNPAYPAFMVFASSIIQPLLIALALPFLLKGTKISGLNTILFSILSTIFIPFLLTFSIRKFFPVLSKPLEKCKPVSFILWLIVLIVATSEASNFIINSHVQHMDLLIIAAISLVLCFINFTFGRKIGGKKFSIEAGQSLGQKNTLFTIWVAITFISPIVAMGPVFYIIWHNLWNAWQLHEHVKNSAA